MTLRTVDDPCPDCNGEGYRPMTEDEMNDRAEHI